MLNALWLLAVLLSAVAAASCASSDAGPADPPESLFDTWNVTAIEGNDIWALLPQGAKAPFLIIAPDGKISGSTGLNALNAKAEPEGLATGAFKLAGIATTRRAGPAPLMAVESAFTDALTTADAYTVRGSTLTLSRGRETMLVFARQSDESPKATPAKAAPPKTRPPKSEPPHAPAADK